MSAFQVVLPDGYLRDVYEEMRAEGAVCVADEVRCSDTVTGVALTAAPLSTAAPDSPQICLGSHEGLESCSRLSQVQCGFGRVGTHFWGFQTQGMVPDMVSTPS